MTATLELSEELEELLWLLEDGDIEDFAAVSYEQCEHWAMLLRSIVLPKPLEGAPGELPTE